VFEGSPVWCGLLFLPGSQYTLQTSSTGWEEDALDSRLTTGDKIHGNALWFIGWEGVEETQLGVWVHTGTCGPLRPVSKWD
jgi:hypothetical protein